MENRFDLGKALYELYRKKPPTHRSGAHRLAYFDGYFGMRNRYRYQSPDWWAYKAGEDNHKNGLLA